MVLASLEFLKKQMRNLAFEGSTYDGLVDTVLVRNGDSTCTPHQEPAQASDLVMEPKLSLTRE